MKKLTNAMRKISKVILPVFFLLLSNTVLAEGNFEAGKALFDANCSSCHSSNLTKDATGPALYGVGERVPGPANEWLTKWIKNNNTLRTSGDVYANGIYKKWGGAAMTAFEWMSDQQLENVIEYITKWELPAPTEGGGGLLPCKPEKKKDKVKKKND